MMTELLLICHYILIIAIIIFMLASIRMASHNTIAMGLIASSVFSFTVALLLLIVGEIHNIGFYRDISIAMILLGFVGTIAFAAVIRRD
jgi:energy-converting hydrogenase B subunit B